MPQDRFPRHFPLSSLLYYSPRCLRRIRSLVKGRPAYIVPGVPNWQVGRTARLKSSSKEESMQGVRLVSTGGRWVSHTVLLRACLPAG